MADGYTGVHAARSASRGVRGDSGAHATVRSTSGAHAVVDALSGAAEAAAADAPLNIPTGLVAGLRTFAGEHGGATAVVEYAGRKGARIVLTGTDGATSGEHYVDTTQAARAACTHAGVGLDNEWERELEEQTASNSRWRTMGRRVLSR